MQRERRYARRPGPVPGTATKAPAIAILLASATGAGAQAPRNVPEWGGKDHQATQANRNNRTADQLDQRLLQKEDLTPPSNSARAESILGLP